MKEESEGYTISDVREMLYRWGDLVRKHGDSTVDGWGWSPANVLEKMKQRKGLGAKADDVEFTADELRISRLELKDLTDVATIARFVRELRPLRVAVLAHLYGHKLSVEDTALQLGARPTWVKETRRETEIALRLWLMELRYGSRPPTPDQGLANAA